MLSACVTTGRVPGARVRVPWQVRSGFALRTVLIAAPRLPAAGPLRISDLSTRSIYSSIR
jgi:hypothetical protein